MRFHEGFYNWSHLTLMGCCYFFSRFVGFFLHIGSHSFKDNEPFIIIYWRLSCLTYSLERLQVGCYIYAHIVWGIKIRCEKLFFSSRHCMQIFMLCFFSRQPVEVGCVCVCWVYIGYKNKSVSFDQWYNGNCSDIKFNISVSIWLSQNSQIY